MYISIIAIEWSKYVPSIIGLIGGGGFLTGVYMLLKLRPEAGQITVTAAQGAVIVQTGVIDNLNKELKRVTDENASLRAKLETETAEREKLKAALKEETEAMQELRERFEQVESKLKLLTHRTTAIENTTTENTK